MKVVNNENYFNEYISATTAGSASQTHLSTDGEIRTGRVYYRLSLGGTFDFSLLFTSITDSTFADGSHSVANTVCDGWDIYSMKLGIVKSCGMNNPTEPESFSQVKFGGELSKKVEKGEIFCTDPCELTCEKGDYLCMEISFCGKMVPYHYELQIASFVKNGEGWTPSVETALPSMIGVKKTVKNRIAYLGDSITQGIGATKNEYRHWNAQLSAMLSDENAFWNIGIGYARAYDAASDGVWLYKAKQNDWVFLCLGVNDTCRDRSAGDIIGSLSKIVRILKAEGIKILIQTVPPFDYNPERKKVWDEVNIYIREVLSKEVDAFFDCVPVLGKSEEEPHIAKYGGHPDDEGCLVWAKALYEACKNLF